MPKQKHKLTPPATKPGFVVVEAVDSIDGGMCLVVNSVRVAGCEPSFPTDNIQYRWNVREEYLAAVLSAAKNRIITD